jgi:ribonuclease-3
MNSLIDIIRLPFRKDKELFSALHDLTGIWPRNIEHYKLALMHRSMGNRNDKGRPLNNERLEFLGDAMLDAAVGEIVYRHFEGKREGFLTNARSKLVQRETLGKLAAEMGLLDLIQHHDQRRSHNSYMGGNAFEALVGAIYLDHGYDAVMYFFRERILGRYIDLDRMAYKEVNFKSKLLEWSQKNRVRMEFRLDKQSVDKQGSPTFVYQVMLEGVAGEQASGFSKKESQQEACRLTLQRLKKEPQFIDAIFSAKSERTKMEEMPVTAAPDAEQPGADDFLIKAEGKAAIKREQMKARFQSAEHEQARQNDKAAIKREPMKARFQSAEHEQARQNDKATQQPTKPRQTANAQQSDEDKDFDLSDITLDGPDREDIIARAEAEAYLQAGKR